MAEKFGKKLLKQMKIRVGPSGGPLTRSTGEVHGPGSMFCICCSAILSLVQILFSFVLGVW